MGDDEDTDDLNEDDESVQDESFNASDDIDNLDMDVDEDLDDGDDSDIEELPTEVDIEKIKKKKPEDDLESEISKLESLQRKINDNLQKASTSKSSETVLLKMRGNLPSPVKTSSSYSVAKTTSTPTTTPTETNTFKETITVDEDVNSASDVHVPVVKEKPSETVEDPITVEPTA